MEEQIRAFIEYLATHRRYAANTLSAYRNDLLQFYQFISAERPHLSSWARVDSLLLQAYLLHLRARRFSPSTIARKIASVKSFYFYLFEQHSIVANPTVALEAPRVSKQPPRPLTQEQVNALLAAAGEPTPKGYRDRAMLELLYATGVRVTELVELPLEAADMVAGTLRVGEVGDSPSAGRTRLLPLSERAAATVRDYLEKGRAEMNVPPDGGALFVNARGEPLTRQGVWVILKQYVKRAGVAADVTPHSLRHSFAAHRLEQGERVEDLQVLLGHQHLSTTQVYSRPRELTPSLDEE